MRSEYSAHNDMRISKQELSRLRNQKHLDDIAAAKRQRNEQRISAFCKAAFWIIIGVAIAIGLKHFGVWL